MKNTAATKTNKVKFTGPVPAELREAIMQYAGRVKEVIVAKGMAYVSYKAGWASGTDPFSPWVHSDYTAIANIVAQIKAAHICGCSQCKWSENE